MNKTIKQLSEEKPILSVGIPLFRAKYIGWLAFLSLSRQENIKFPWEIVIAEEKHYQPLGFNAILDYKDALAEIGCSRIVYISLENWIPLGDKWIMLANNCYIGSNYFLLQPADYYSAPRRLTRTYSLFRKNKAHWIHDYKRIIYSIRHDKVGLIVQNDLLQNPSNRPGGAAAARTVHMKGLPRIGKTKGCDGWMFTAIKHKVKARFRASVDKSENWKYALATYGLNNISGRNADFKGKGRTKNRMFQLCKDNTYLNNIPNDVIKRLKSFRKLSSHWPRRIWRKFE